MHDLALERVLGCLSSRIANANAPTAGAPSCPAMSGTLYCFSAGLVFVEGISKAIWVLDLRRPNGLEAVTMQQLPPVVSAGTGTRCCGRGR